MVRMKKGILGEADRYLKELDAEKLVVVEEFDRQQHYANILYSAEFFENNVFAENMSVEQRRLLERKLEKERTMLPDIDQACSDNEADAGEQLCDGK